MSEPEALVCFVARSLQLQALAETVKGATLVCPTLTVDMVVATCLSLVPLLDACDAYKRAFIRHRVALDEYNLLPVGDELRFTLWGNIVQLDNAKRRTMDALLDMAAS